MVIDMAVAEHAPRPPGHVSEEWVIGPAPSRCTNRKLLDVVVKATRLDVPGARLARKKLVRRWGVSRKGDHARNNQIDRRDAQPRLSRPCGKLVERQREAVVDMREHARGSHGAPFRTSVGSEQPQPAEQGRAVNATKEGSDQRGIDRILAANRFI